MEDLVGEMPLKVTYPALESHEWQIVIGYHNDGSWPVLLWLLTAAYIKIGRPDIARKTLELAEGGLHKDGWPEHHDGKNWPVYGQTITRDSNLVNCWLLGFQGDA